MKPSLRWTAWTLCCVPALLLAAEIGPIPAETARGLAGKLSEKASQLDKLKFKIDPDQAQANGVHVPDKLGMLVVPQQGLKESEELAAKFKMDPGAPVAYLFLYHLVPLVEGKPLAADRLLKVEFQDEGGETHTVHGLALAIRQLAGDDYRLYGFGTDGQPVIDVKFGEGSSSLTGPVTVELKEPNPDTRQGKAAVTVFGKYQATIPVAFQE